MEPFSAERTACGCHISTICEKLIWCALMFPAFKLELSVFFRKVEVKCARN